jgi:LPXTG-motif cell wall-anchored protein
MKVCRYLFIAILSLALTSTLAFAAVPSPEGNTVTGYDSNNRPIGIVLIPVEKSLEDWMISNWTQYVKDTYGDDYIGEHLITGDLIYTGIANGPVNIILNVSGIKAGDTIIIAHRLADGSIEYITVIATEDGVLRFTLNTLDPTISIFRVVKKGAVVTPGKLPKTGDAGTMLPAALLLVTSLSAITLLGRAYRKDSK